MGGSLKKPLLFLLCALTSAVGWSAPQAPCLFIFGDSLLDNGNNNGILTLARANYLPYGVDFLEGPSGRFSNGRTTVDILAQLLGFRSFIPPYSSVQESEVLRGVNYASGAAGIRDETGNNLGEHYSFTEQVEHFHESVETMRKMFGRNSTKLGQHLSKCIFYVGMGSNDYLNNYFMPGFYSTGSDYNPKTYAALLLQDYCRLINKMYELGARKVAVVGVGQIGCIPYELARLDNDGKSAGKSASRCNEKINKAISMFNAGLLQVVKKFNREMPCAKLVYVNTYQSSQDLVMNAVSYGFEETERGCCGVGRNNGQMTCLPLQVPCGRRRSYLFWDAFHPTEVANEIYALKAYNSTSLSDVYPINIRQLALV